MNNFDFWNFNANSIIAFSAVVIAVSMVYIAVKLSETSSSKTTRTASR